jgi:uroporphyrinogen decarboxylase
MTSAERVLAALRREEPDRIPHFEWIIDRRVRDAICPGASMEEFTVRMGLDAILTAPDFRKEPLGPGLTRSEWGMVMKDSGEEHGVAVEHPIRTLDDLRAYRPPDPHAPGRYASVERTVARYKGRLAVGVHLNDVFSIPRYLAGFETLMMAFAEEPELIHRLVDISVDTNVEMAKEVARRGVDFVFTGDDYASASGPFVSPAMFREFFLPHYVPLCELLRGRGVETVFVDSDGCIDELIPLWLEVGVNGFSPLEVAAGEDAVALKKRYGRDIVLAGNIDKRALARGRAEIGREVAKARRLLDLGGYFPAVDHSVPPDVPLESFHYLLRALRA